jgi:hypothetical protein
MIIFVIIDGDFDDNNVTKKRINYSVMDVGFGS